jgi:hypothetical protein
LEQRRNCSRNTNCNCFTITARLSYRNTNPYGCNYSGSNTISLSNSYSFTYSKQIGFTNSNPNALANFNR